MSTWEETARSKRQACLEKIPTDWKIPDHVLDGLKLPGESNRNNIFELGLVRKSGILTERELHITEDCDVSQLLKALSKGDFTAVEVTRAFSKRAAIAQQLVCIPYVDTGDGLAHRHSLTHIIFQVNCLTETYFEEAIDRAEALDRLKASGQLAGPLHGLPISLKDSFQIRGSQATLGIVSFLNRFSERNAALVDILIGLGAVLYVKTNVPQTLAVSQTQLRPVCHHHNFDPFL